MRPTLRPCSLAHPLAALHPRPPACIFCAAPVPFPPFLLDSDQNCEHYTSAWVLDCVLDCICHQMSTLHAAEPQTAEELAAAAMSEA